LIADHAHPVVVGMCGDQVDRQNRETGKMDIDRSAISQALAKAIAFKQCGKDEKAAIWARRLVELLELTDILNETLNQKVLGEIKWRNL
jgi:hypothetical protein